jgi:hypothetical protein
MNAPAGSARGRIARQGGRIVHSRSPSSSPIRVPREVIDLTKVDHGPHNSESRDITSPIVRRHAKRVKSPTSPPLGHRMSSPPSSPTHSALSSPLHSPVRSQAYISRYDSSDSLNANESSALIKDGNDSSRSQSSVCIYFDDFGIKDTLVWVDYREQQMENLYSHYLLCWCVCTTGWCETFRYVLS